MEPPQDLAQWACGLCDSTAAELSTPTHPPLDGRSVIRAGSSSLLVMTFDRSYGSEKVSRRDDRKMLHLHNCLECKRVQAAFTKSAEDPPSACPRRA